jgi:hypothetical protein
VFVKDMGGAASHLEQQQLLEPAELMPCARQHQHNGPLERHSELLAAGVGPLGQQKSDGQLTS